MEKAAAATDVSNPEILDTGFLPMKVDAPAPIVIPGGWM
jgi:hypothetical protein